MLRGKLPVPPSERSISQVDKSHSEALPPYWGSWRGRGDADGTSFTGGTIPPTSLWPRNDRINSPRKATVEASTFFRIRKQVPATDPQVNTHVTGGGGIVGRCFSRQKQRQLLYQVHVDEPETRLPPDGSQSRGSADTPDDRIASDVQSDRGQGFGSASTGSVHPMPSLIGSVQPTPPTLQKAGCRCFFSGCRVVNGTNRLIEYQR